MKIISTYSAKIKESSGAFEATAVLYRRAVDYFIGIMLKHWDGSFSTITNILIFFRFLTARFCIFLRNLNPGFCIFLRFSNRGKVSFSGQIATLGAFLPASSAASASAFFSLKSGMRMETVSP